MLRLYINANESKFDFVKSVNDSANRFSNIYYEYSKTV